MLAYHESFEAQFKQLACYAFAAGVFDRYGISQSSVGTYLGRDVRDRGFLVTIQAPVSFSHPHSAPRAAPTKLDIEVDINLMQDDPEIIRLDIRQHDKLEVCRRFVVVQLVCAGAVRQEGVLAGRQISDPEIRRGDSS